MNKPSLFFILALLVFSISFISSSCDSGQIDINTASKEDVMKIKGLGGEGIIAQRVIDARPFNSIDDLIDVKGIGNVTLTKIKDDGLACVSGESEEAEEQEENSNKTNISDKEIARETVINDKSNPTVTGMQTIELNPKVIKRDTDSQVLDKGNLALYALITFGVLLGLLFLVKNLKKGRKNEFR
jgi:hypothetical protein